MTSWKRAAATSTAKTKNNEKLRNGPLERVPKILGVTREAPEHRGDPGAAGVDLAAVEVTGSEEDNVERVA